MGRATLRHLAREKDQASSIGLQRTSSISLLTYLILCVGAIASIAAFFMSRDVISKSGQLKFERIATEAHHQIEARVKSYSDVLYGLRAFIDSRGHVTRREFHDYIEGLDLPNRFPGFINLNYAAQVSGNDKRQFEARMRRDISNPLPLYSSFRIIPDANRDSYHPLIYLVPILGNEGSLGRDLLMPVERKAAFDAQVRDSGKVSSSGRPILITGESQFYAHAMRLGVYGTLSTPESIELRRRYFKGSVGAGFKMRELMDQVLDRHLLTAGLHFKVFDTGLAAVAPQQRMQARDRFLLFDSHDLLVAASRVLPSAESERYRLHSVLPLEVAGRAWELHFDAPNQLVLSTTDAAIPWVLMLGGILITFLVFAFVRSLAMSRRHAIKLAHEITSDLRESEANLAEAQRMAAVGSWTLDPSSAEMTWSAETYRILGVRPGTVTPCHEEFMSRIHGEDAARLAALLQFPFTKGHDHRLEHRFLLNDGSIRWAQTIARDTEMDGRKIVQGTLMDITERRENNHRRLMEHRVTQIVAGAQHSSDIVPGIIQVLCSGTEWDCGSHWSLDRTGKQLHCTASWGANTPLVWEFLAITRGKMVAKGMGLPGRCWAEGHPVFVQDVSALQRPGRAQAALAAGIRGAVAIPIAVGGEFFGVIELFSRQAVAPDENTTRPLASVGAQIGQFFRRLHLRESTHEATHDARIDATHRAFTTQDMRQIIRNSSETVDGQNLQQLVVAASIGKAMQDQQFELHYQPVLGLRPSRITRIEALLRWNHPDWGMLKPLEFLSLAEETGQSVDLGEHVLRLACLEIIKLHVAGPHVPPVSLNLAPQQMLHENFLETLSRTMAETGIHPDWLEIEVSEHLLCRYPERAGSVVRGAMSLGVGIVIDDFHGEFSFVTESSRFAVRCVKVDCLGIAIHAAREDPAIVSREIIAAARRMRCDIVAKGIESPDQRSLLMAIDIDALQGFAFSKPLAAKEVSRLLRDHFPTPNLKIVGS